MKVPELVQWPKQFSITERPKQFFMTERPSKLWAFLRMLDARYTERRQHDLNARNYCQDELTISVCLRLVTTCTSLQLVPLQTPSVIGSTLSLKLISWSVIFLEELLANFAMRTHAFESLKAFHRSRLAGPKTTTGRVERMCYFISCELLVGHS